MIATNLLGDPQYGLYHSKSSLMKFLPRTTKYQEERYTQEALDVNNMYI